jgi:hypothetical protein
MKFYVRPIKTYHVIICLIKNIKIKKIGNIYIYKQGRGGKKKKKLYKKLMIFILLVKFSISIFIFNLFMCISPINNDKINSINPIDPHTSI